MELGEITAQSKIFPVSIRCQSYTHNSSNNYQLLSLNVKDQSQIHSSSIRKSHNFNNSQQQQTYTMLNKQSKTNNKRMEAQETMILYLK